MTEVESVYCAVRTESLCTTDTFSLYTLNIGPTTDKVTIILAVVSWVAVTRENYVSSYVCRV